MAYLAFYRMFRPDSFESVVRQEHIIRILKNQISEDRIGHAYLFCGPRGTGKTTVARIFARAINCENPVDGSPCGKCAVCRALASASSMDITEIDAASNNGVDEMRALREKVQYPPVSGNYKVYIIDEVHMLTDSAFNALLKTLEEPPKHAVFIMATTEPHKIPATILSRCMRFDFKLIPQSDLEEHLKFILDKTGKEYEAEAVSAIARAGAGSDRDMLSIADMCVSYSSGKLTYEDVTRVLGSADFSNISALVGNILSGETESALTRFENIISGGKSVGVFVKDILNFLNWVTVAKICRDGDKILSLPERMYKEIKEISSLADGHRLLRLTEIFTGAESDMKYSSSPGIVLETAVLKASMPETDYNIDALISRISALEEAVKNGITVKAERKTEISQSAADSIDEKSCYEEEPVFNDEPPLYDEPVFDEISYEIPVEEKKPRQIKEGPKVERSEEPFIGVGQPVAPKAPADVKTNAFGKFLRAIRKTNKNSVLFVMCQDLRTRFDGDTFVLITESDVVYKSLTRSEHTAAIKTALDSIGITDFKIENGKKKEEESLLNKVKSDFGDVNIETK